MSTNNKVYEIVNEKILAELEKGTIPWRKPWASCGAAGGHGPLNLISGKPYRGINTFLLNASPFASPYWLTFKQCEAKGGRVLKGSRSTLVIFWKMYETTEKDASGRVKALPVLRYYNVFNVEQTEGLKLPTPEPVDPAAPTFTPIETAERIAAAYPLGPTIDHGGDRAYYRPSTDHVQMPPREAFTRPEEYYSTLFHELTHSTGAARRLNREGITEQHFFGDAIYSKEELVAEFGAAFLCGAAGIENTVPNSAAYIQSWARAIKSNKLWLVHAAAAGQRAADYVQGITQAKEKAAELAEVA